MVKLLEENQLTEQILKKEIREGYRNLKSYLERLKNPYWYDHVKLRDCWMKEKLYERVKLDEERGRPDNKYLEDKKAMGESLKKGLYFPLVTQGTNKPPFEIHAGRHRFVKLKELIARREISPDLKIPMVGINRRHYDETKRYVEVPKPINRLVRISFKRKKPLEGYEKTNIEEETKSKYWVMLTNGESHFAALNLISQRTSYYLYKWREIRGDHPIPSFTSQDL